MLVKHYGASSDKEAAGTARPSLYRSSNAHQWKADPAHISTSFVERQNLTMRMGMRRFTRLTNGFSKKVENLEHAVSLHFLHYNFARIHKTLRVTPAMEAGLAIMCGRWKRLRPWHHETKRGPTRGPFRFEGNLFFRHGENSI